MTKFNSIGLAGMFLAAGTVCPSVMANSIVLTQTEYYFADGGEFTAVTSPGSFAQFYAPSTQVAVGSQTGFQTFCVEADVYFWGNVTYSYTLSGVDSQGRALTEGAAYLYSQFAQGVLTGYDFNNNGAVIRTQDAGLLQSAIWYLQGGQSGGGSFAFGGAGNPFYNLAASVLGANLETAASADQYGVQIMELWDSSQNTYQNQLVFDDPAVPDRGTTLALLGLSLAGLAVCAQGFGAGSLAVQRCSPARPGQPSARLGRNLRFSR
jgi:hypothetical protein